MKKLDIRRALKEHGVNQATLCERTGLRSQNIKSLIDGNPTVTKLQQVAEGIGCDITDLFYSPEDENVEQDSQEPIFGNESYDRITTCPYCSKRFILLDK